MAFKMKGSPIHSGTADAKINKKLLADADKKANTQKAADALEKNVASSAMKNMKTGKYNHSFAKKKYKK